MTNPNFEPRLDQVEEIAAILVTDVEAIDSRLEQVTQRLDRVAANQEQWEARQQATDRRLNTLTNTVDTLAALMTETTEEMRRRDRQAELDRAEFRTTVQGILDVLTQRFSSNGHES